VWIGVAGIDMVDMEEATASDGSEVAPWNRPHLLSRDFSVWGVFQPNLSSRWRSRIRISSCSLTSLSTSPERVKARMARLDTPLRREISK
jgi:hypothetical protein